VTSIALPRSGRPQIARSEVYGARYLIAFAVTLASVLELVDTSIVNVAIPHMMGNLGATLDEIAWVSTGYIVANVIILPLTGWLSERLGRRNYYTGSIALFTLASFFCGHATTLHDLVFWRVVQGIGGGALISTAQAILFDVFPRREAGTAMAIFGMGVMVGPTLGPTLGGWITDNYAWPWIFYINVPLGVFAGMMTWRYVPEPEHHIDMPDHVDWKGLALLILGIGALQICLERGEAHDWFASREIITELTVAVTALLLFVWHELRTPFPVVNLRVLANRQLTIGVIFGLLLGFALYSSVFALPVFLQGYLGYTAWDTGLVILPGALASAVTMAIAGRFNTRIDARLSITVGVLLFALSMWQHAHFTLALGMGDLRIPMILRGTAMGLIFVPLTAATVADLPSRQMAQGTGLFNLSRQIGGSFGIAITATILQRFTEQAREALRPHLGVTDAAPRQWVAGLEHHFLQQGGTPGEAAHKAMAVLNGLLHQQAAVIAFEKVFFTMGATFLLALPLLLLMRTGKAAPGAGPAH